MTPYEIKTDTQPHVGKFRTLFCSATCYLYGEAQEPSKLSPRVAEGIHHGIDQHRGGYFVYLFDINRLTTVRFIDVKFDESVFPGVKRTTGTFVSHTTRYSLPSVAQQVDMQTPQRSIVLPSAYDKDIISTSQIPPIDGTPTNPAATPRPPPVAQPSTCNYPTNRICI
eukprot:5364299-Pleurochrysis_carterae.AAC.2